MIYPRHSLALAILLCVAFTSYSQSTSYKEALPALVAEVHTKIDAGLATLQQQFIDTTYLEYHRDTYQSILKEATKFYQEHNYDQFYKKVESWEELIYQALGSANDNPVARRTQLMEAMNAERIDTGPVTTSFNKFLEAYDSYAQWVWFKKENDSTKFIVFRYMSRMKDLRTEIDRSRWKSNMGRVLLILKYIEGYQQLVDFSVISTSLYQTVRLGRSYLNDEEFLSADIER